MHSIKHILVDTFGFASGFTFTLLYVTVFGKNASQHGIDGGKLGLPYTLKMTGAIILFLIAMHFFGKIRTHGKPDDSIFSLLGSLIIVAVSCGVGMYLAYQAYIFA